jgi:hypothetical protein
VITVDVVFLTTPAFSDPITSDWHWAAWYLPGEGFWCFDGRMSHSDAAMQAFGKNEFAMLADGWIQIKVFRHKGVLFLDCWEMGFEQLKSIVRKIYVAGYIEPDAIVDVNTLYKDSPRSGIKSYDATMLL